MKKKYTIENLRNALGGNTSYLVEIINLFVKQVPESISEIEKALVNKNWEVIHHEVHRMKSTFALFGMEEQRELLIKAEEYIANKNHIRQISKLISAVSKEVNLAIIELKKEKI